MKRLLMVFLLLSFSTLSYADNAQMKEALVKIIAELQSIKPLITEAEKAQDKNPRIKVHFNSWTDASGIKHSGLRQDIEAIQKALIRIVNGEMIEPRVYAPIQNDFIGKNNV